MQHKWLVTSLAVGTLVIGSAGLAQAHDSGKGMALAWGSKSEKHLEHKAELLGMSVEELKKQLDAGKTPKEIAEAQGLTKEEMKKRHEELRQKHLDQMVADGKLTKEKAEELAKNPPKHGMGHGHRGHMKAR